MKKGDMIWWYQNIIKAQLLSFVCFTMKSKRVGEIGIWGCWLYFSDVYLLSIGRCVMLETFELIIVDKCIIYVSYLICITIVTFVSCLEPHIFVCCMHIICYGIICILFVGRLTFAQPRICQSLEQARAGRGKT